MSSAAKSAPVIGARITFQAANGQSVTDEFTNYESFVFNAIAQGLLPMPMWIPQSTFALGAILLFVAVVDELVVVVRGGRPSYAVAVEERHAHGDFSSDV